jgi:hypothetical protein
MVVKQSKIQLPFVSLRYCGFYASANKSVIKSIRMRWAEHAARMGARKGAYRVLVGKPQ